MFYLYTKKLQGNSRPCCSEFSEETNKPQSAETLVLSHEVQEGSDPERTEKESSSEKDVDDCHEQTLYFRPLSRASFFVALSSVELVPAGESGREVFFDHSHVLCLSS